MDPLDSTKKLRFSQDQRLPVIRKALAHEMTKLKRQIVVVPYDPQWPVMFKNEVAAISRVLGDHIIHSHHIGSTAVPGLKAKPTIDILLEVKDVTLLDEYDAGMNSLGYILKGEHGIPGRRFYLKGLYNRTHHVHAFNVGSTHVRRHTAFRDYLIAHPSIAREYEELKLRCAAECDNDSNKYCDGKDEFVREHERRAIEWCKCQRYKG